MRYAWGVAVGGSALIVGSTFVGSAIAQQNARAFLQTADKATGASKVNSIQYTGTGWIAFLGQNFSTVDDWPRVDLKTYTATIDYETQVGVGRLYPRAGQEPATRRWRRLPDPGRAAHAEFRQWALPPGR